MARNSFMRIEAVPGKSRRKDFGIGNARVYKREIDRALQYTKDAVKRDLEATVSTWKEKPEFEVEDRYERGNRIITAKTNNEIYNMLDAGTRPHIIRPKKAQVLSFWSDYQAKTSAAANAFRARAGGPRGERVFARVVNHPGTKARNFYSKVAQRNQRKFELELETALAIAENA